MPPRRGGEVRDQVREGIAEQEAQQGDAQAHRQRAREERDVDAPVRGLPRHRTVGQAGQVHRRQVVPRRVALARRAQRVPGFDFFPGGIDLHHRGAPVIAGGVPQPPRGNHQHAAQPALNAVDPAGYLADGPLLLRDEQFPGRRLECSFFRDAHAVPIVQQRNRFRQRVGDHRVMDAAHQHRHQRRHEGHAHERHQRQRQARRAQPPTHRDLRRGPAPGSRSASSRSGFHRLRAPRRGRPCSESWR